MKHLSYRVLILGSLVAVAASAQAFSIDLQSHGTYVSASSPFFSTTETVVFQDTNPGVYPMLTNLYFEIPIATSSPEPADGYFTNGPDSFKFNASVESISTFGSTESAAGTWTFYSGAGAFSNIVSGGGTFSLSIDPGTGNKAYSAFVGELTPVPEPATFAPLAIGVVGLLIRRKKA